MYVRGIITVFISAAIATIASLAFNFFSTFLFSAWPASILSFSVFCLILNLIYSFKAKSDTFTELLIFSFSIKLLLAFISLFIYSVLSFSTFYNFSVHFLIHYLIFTILEINYLLYLIRITKNG